MFPQGGADGGHHASQGLGELYGAGPRGSRQAPQRQTTLAVGLAAYPAQEPGLPGLRVTLAERSHFSARQPLDPKCRIVGDQRGGATVWDSVYTHSGRGEAAEQENRPMGARAVVGPAKGQEGVPGGWSFCHSSYNHLPRRVNVTEY